MNSINNFSKYSNAGAALENFDAFLLTLFENSGTSLLIEVESSECNGPPELIVTLNEQIIFCQEIVAGIHTYDIAMLQCKNSNVLSLGMTNKQPYDTVLKDNVIIQDKWLKLRKLEINGYNLVTDYDFFNNVFKYYVDDVECSPMPGFWHNSQLKLVFDSPFELWYNTIASRHVTDELAGRVVESNTILSQEEKIKKLLTTLKF